MQLDPRLAHAYFGRGTVRLARGETEKAVADFDRALGLDERLAGAYAHRGLALILQGKNEQGEKDLSRALLLDPRLRATVEEIVRVRKPGER